MSKKHTFIVTIKEELRAAEDFVNSVDIKYIEEIVQELLRCTGKIVITGIGKSGHIGRKIAATLSSTGTTSIFMHATEGFHGDLGVVKKEDFIVLISYSGETDEVVRVLNYCLKEDIKSLSITGNKNSTLFKNSTFSINASVEHEACPLDLAPTSSTTLALLIGDGIAVSLMKKRNFRENDFARYHPGGSLGKKLLSKAGDYMHRDYPIIDISRTLKDLLNVITKYSFGISLIYDQNKFVGIITDGDLRRYLNEQENVLDLNSNIQSLVNSTPIFINVKESIGKCEETLNQFKINCLIVEDRGEPIGIITRSDLA